MLKRKDVLKWIKNLKRGSGYRKGEGELVSLKGDAFCCLGVWADMHGATWSEVNDFGKKNLIPVFEGKSKPNKDQSYDVLCKANLFGLPHDQQYVLSLLNDQNKTWKEVIAHIKSHILPLAK